MSFERGEQDIDQVRLEELKMSLRGISIQDRNPFFEEKGETLKILTDYGFSRNRTDIMRSALAQLKSDSRFTDVITVDPEHDQAHLEATLVDPIGKIQKLNFYAYKDM